MLIVVLALVPRLARAAALESVAGWEGDNREHGYGFVGLSACHPISSHFTVSVGTSISYLYYGYDSSGAAISVRSSGASLLTGLRFHVPRSSVTVLAGAETRWDHQKTSVPDSPTRKSTTMGGVIQFYGEQAWTRRWSSTQFVVYVGSARYTVARAAVRSQISNLDGRKSTSLSVGAEGVRQGNQSTDAVELGGFAEGYFLPLRMSLGLHSGYKETWSPGGPHGPGTYLGMSFYRHF